MKRVHRASFLIVAFLFPGLHSLAAGSPAGAQAEALFREAKGLMAAGKISEACAAFDDSQKLDPTVSTLLNAANCREKNHQLATAWGLFLEAERQTRGATDPPTQKLHNVAVEHAKRVETRVSTLTLRVSPEVRAQHPEIRRGADSVDMGLWNRALPLDGGTYIVKVTATEKAAWTATVVLAPERDVKTVDIPVLSPVVVDAPAPVAVAPNVVPVTPVSPPSPVTAAALPPPAPTDATPAVGPTVTIARTTATKPTRALPLALGGGAVLALGGALVFDLLGDSKYSQAKTEPDPTRQDDLWHQANTLRYVAEGLLVAGLGCAGTAAWLYFRAPSVSSTGSLGTVGLMVAPVVGVDRTGLGVAGRF